MPQQLSSRWTLFYKVALPPIWLLLGVWLALLASDAPDPLLLPFFGVWAGVALFVLWLAGALKHVLLEGDALEIRGLRESLRVPLRDCESVSGTSLLNPELVWIRFRRPTAFGSRVSFVPRRRGFRPFTPHPALAALRALIQEQQAPGLPPPIDAEPGRRSALRAVALGALALGVAGALLVGGVRALLRSANPVSLAFERARAHPALAAELGEPIEPGWLPSGRVRVDEEGGSAQLEIPVSGPRGEARLHVRATRRGGEWVLLELRAVLADGRSLDLLDEAGGEAEPPGELP